MKKIMAVVLAAIFMLLPIAYAAELAKVPDTIRETEAKIGPGARYLMYTHNGKNIMWGRYGRGYFVGQDNQGKKAWGFYGKYVFAGLYDGKFFWGRYHKDTWTAHGLFGMRTARGKYVTFPTLAAKI